jgi:macrolide-specific efflux system membrane fusion protein
MPEMRNVTVGVTDRVSAEILSGLSEGEKVIAGTQTASNHAARPQARPPGVPGLGGFR